jgi:hypothetical protein
MYSAGSVDIMTLIEKVLYCPTCNEHTQHKINTDLGFIAQCQQCKEINQT